MFEEKKQLRIPGPTPVPPRIYRALARPVLGHRSKEFAALFSDVTERSKMLFQTEGDVVIFASSGTGGMEAAVVNAVAPGEKMLVASCGVFGDRWAKIGEAYGAVVEKVSVEWGNPIDPQLIAAKLDADPSIKAVFTTHNETSTGVMNDLEQVAKVVKARDVLLVVDAISALGGIEMKMDEWGVDIVVAGSQKSLMLPPGLALVAFNKKAWEVMENTKSHKFYFDLIDMAKKAKDGQTSFTPAVSMVFGLDESLRMLEEEGLQNTFKRHIKLKNMVRAGVRALGLEFFAANEECASNVITSIKKPEGIATSALRKIMNDKYHIVVAGGQGKLKDDIFRIGHMGYMDELDLVATIAALEMALVELGYPVKLGTGVAACEEVLVR